MKYKTIFLCNHPEQVNYVYSPDRKARLAELTDLREGTVTAEELANGGFSDVEIVFSTWGMPSLSEEELAKYLPNLKAVFYGAGATDAFVRPLLARGVKVLSAWQANAIPVAEFCVAQILLSLKGYFRNSREIHRTGDWQSGKPCIGPGVYGETVALIGAGAISTKVRELLQAFQINVVVVPSRPERRTVSLGEVFQTALVISNHLPNRDDNIGVLHRGLFASMRPGATFINTGRGAQVDEAGLVEVLESRPDLTALLDVTWPEPPPAGSKLYTLPNIRLSSHIAGSVNDEVHRMADYMIEELKRFLAGEPLRYEVNESMLLTSRK